MTDVTARGAGLDPAHVQTITDAADALTAVVAAYEAGVEVALDHIGGMSGEDVRLALLTGAALVADMLRDRGLPPMTAEPPACARDYRAAEAAACCPPATSAPATARRTSAHRPPRDARRQRGPARGRPPQP